MIFEMSEIEEKIGYTFKNKNFLRLAFTHSSYANENNTTSNETLEFLGDSLLNFIIAEHLYLSDKESDEGGLTKKRSNLVSTMPLAEIVEQLDVSKYLLLGNGESKTREYAGKKQFADIFESIIAAIYLDSDIKTTRNFILRYLIKDIKKVKEKNVKTKDFKTFLQEYAQKNKLGKIEYVFSKKSGEEHMPVFEYKVVLAGVEYPCGIGSSIKDAQQDAAKNVVNKLKLR